jgi:hypothetical protein
VAGKPSVVTSDATLAAGTFSDWLGFVPGKPSVVGSDATLVAGAFSDWLGFVTGKHFIGGSDTYTEVNFSDWLGLWRENFLLVDQMRHSSQGPSLIGWDSGGKAFNWWIRCDTRRRDLL